MADPEAPDQIDNDAGRGSPSVRISPIPLRARGFDRTTIPWISPVTFGAILCLWWAATISGMSPFGVPSPVEVFRAAADLVRSGEIWAHLGASFQRLAMGCLLGILSGIVLGFAIGISPLVRSAAVPLVSALFAIPKIAILPVLIVCLGIGELSKIVTIALGVFSPMVIATYTGVDNVDRNLIRMGQSFDMPMHHIVAKILLPGALPTLVGGLRVAMSIGIVLLTAAEMIGAQSGIGAFILRAGNLMRTDQMFAGIILLAGIGILSSFLLGRTERALLHWR
ncbi:ABC transporter permease [Mesorhizobium sp. LHD-90]|uniref:ABC transporter permease n=1 Tax=Mesorhizobium sp. LHD-90 TaxID=3071414 RepID=UPI0027DF89EF|nr:ABC transporter permease [Mesorhizobium sp. LHD-90]MDQ6438124.1 ABC transporter permease [Mesorhizobium sp. LHD-90]